MNVSGVKPIDAEREREASFAVFVRERSNLWI